MAKTKKPNNSSSSSSTIPVTYPLKLVFTHEETVDVNGTLDGFVERYKVLDAQNRGALRLTARLTDTISWSSDRPFLFLPDGMYQWRQMGSAPRTLYTSSREPAAYASVGNSLTCGFTGIGGTTLYYTILAAWNLPLFTSNAFRPRKPSPQLASPVIVRATIVLAG